MGSQDRRTARSGHVNSEELVHAKKSSVLLWRLGLCIRPGPPLEGFGGPILPPLHKTCASRPSEYPKKLSVSSPMWQHNRQHISNLSFSAPFIVGGELFMQLEREGIFMEDTAW